MFKFQKDFAGLVTGLQLMTEFLKLVRGVLGNGDGWAFSIIYSKTL